MGKQINQNKVKILTIVLLLTIVRYYLERNSALSKTSLLITIFTVAFSLFIFFISRDSSPNLNSNFFKTSTLFIFGFVVVHFFEYLAFVIGEHDSIIDVGYIDSNYVNEAALCSCASLITFLIGYLCTNNPFKPVLTIKVKSKTVFELLMLLSLVIFYFTAGLEYFKGGYSSILNGVGLSLWASLSQTILLASQVVCAMTVVYQNHRTNFKDYFKSYSVVYYISIIFYCYLILSSGDRGPLFQTAICFIAPYFIVNKIKLRFISASVIICVSALFFSLLGTVRSMDGDLSISKIEEAQQFRNERFEDENIVFLSTAELSNVVRSYHVLYYYSRTQGYLYGLGYVNQILGIIPGLRYAIYPLFGIDDKKITTALISTKLLQSDHGMGSTCVADTFYNFGFWGTIFVFWVFGVFIRKIDLSTYDYTETTKPFWLCAVICYLMFGIYIGRGYLLSPLNVFAYSFGLFYINNSISVR